MEAELQKLDDRLQNYEEIIVKYANEKDSLETGQEQWEREREELQNTNISLERQLAEEQRKLEDAVVIETELRLEVEKLQKDARVSRDKHQSGVKDLKAEIKSLQLKIEDLSDNTRIREKQKALDRLQAEHQNSSSAIKELTDELELVERERSELQERLLEIEKDIDQKVLGRVIMEKNKTKTLEMTIERLKQQHEDDISHYRAMEKEKNELVKDFEELKNWKVVCEAGHGLQELARNQKALKDENKRRTVEKEQLLTQNSMLMDSNAIFAHAFEKLKAETGRKPDFFILSSYSTTRCRV